MINDSWTHCDIFIVNLNERVLIHYTYIQLYNYVYINPYISTLLRISTHIQTEKLRILTRRLAMQMSAARARGRSRPSRKANKGRGIRVPEGPTTTTISKGGRHLGRHFESGGGWSADEQSRVTFPVRARKSRSRRGKRRRRRNTAVPTRRMHVMFAHPIIHWSTYSAIYLLNYIFIGKQIYIFVIHLCSLVVVIVYAD